MACTPPHLDARREVVRPMWTVCALLLIVAAGALARHDVGGSVSPLGVMAGTPAAAADTAGPRAARAGSPHGRTFATLAIYHVRPGDTLESVAAMHAVPVGELVGFNRALPAGALRPGDVLHIPDLPARPAGLDIGHRSGVADLVQAWAQRVGLPPELLLAVAWRESSFRQDVTSDKGAVGIGQVLPDTAAWVSSRLAGRPLDPYVAEDNVEASARYLVWLLDREDGDLAAALADYHQGPLSVANEGWYPVTERYVADVLRLRHEFT